MTGPVLGRPPGWRPPAVGLLLLLVAGLPATATAQPMPIMMTVGCVEPAGPGGFDLVRATEPEPVQDRMPEQPAADAPLGSRTIRLIGTLDEFGVDRRAGHKVWAQGLLNPDTEGGADRLNLTSITTLSDRCE